jgi:hypothetical protein
VHDAQYDAAARFDTLAAERTSQTGAALIAAADTFRDAVADALEAWEDETADGRSLRRPTDFAEVADLYALADQAARLARTVAHRRSLSFVLAEKA